MKKISKFIALLLAALMLTGCGSSTVVNVEGTLEAKPAQTSSITDEESQQTTAATTAATTTEATTAATTTTATTTEATTADTTADEPAETEATTTTTAPVTEATTTATTTAQTTTEPTTQEEIPVETKYIALTFDDGPNTTTTAEVLDVLEKYDIVASFFLIGNNITDDSAKVVKRAYDMGCEINNHSKTHPYMNEMTVDQIIEEFTYTDDKIFEITGERSKFFRPPYIAVSDDMQANIDVPFIAGFGCNDWDDNVPADRRAKMIIKQAKDGGIILLHDAQGNSKTVEALDTIIPELLAQGYRFVTVTELFNVKGIAISADDNKIYTNVLQTGIYG